MPARAITGDCRLHAVFGFGGEASIRYRVAMLASAITVSSILCGYRAAIQMNHFLFTTSDAVPLDSEIASANIIADSQAFIGLRRTANYHRH